MTLAYRRVMGAIIGGGRARVLFFGGVAALLLAAIVLVPLQIVTVKMLPFDNKSEFQVMVRLPEGTALEETARVTSALAARVIQDPAVVNVQTYVGTSAPSQLQRPGAPLLPEARAQPRRSSGESHGERRAERAKPRHCQARARCAAASGDSPWARRFKWLKCRLARQCCRRSWLKCTDRTTNAGSRWRERCGAYSTRRPVWWTWIGTSRKNSRSGSSRSTTRRRPLRVCPPASVATVVRMAGAGETVGLLHDEMAREAVPIVLRLDRQSRGSLDAVRAVRLEGRAPVAIGELTRSTLGREARNVYHKNLQPVTYVTGDIAGAAESPVYSILQMNRALESLALPEGYGFEIFNATQPFDTTRYAMKWDGEWHISYEVFRDLGLAFAAVLLLIYVLVVGWFQSFTTPLIIMAAIPFSLVGILPAHAAMGAFFTATSMIGFIAGAGIVVRNSIILVDFIELRLRDGMPLDQAVIDAGAVRFRPMALTAAAVIVGAGVILFDPIFQGLAISLMAGEVASLLLSRMAVPVMYFVMNRETVGG